MISKFDEKIGQSNPKILPRFAFLGLSKELE